MNGKIGREGRGGEGEGAEGRGGREGERERRGGEGEEGGKGREGRGKGEEEGGRKAEMCDKARTKDSLPETITTHPLLLLLFAALPPTLVAPRASLDRQR